MKILAISDFHGESGLMDNLVVKIKENSPDLIVFTGDVVKGHARGDEWLSAQKEGREPLQDKDEIQNEKNEDFKLYDEFYDKLHTLNIPVLCIPGNMDSPEDRFFSYLLGKYMRTNIKVAQENIFEKDGYLISGMGGEITINSKEDFFVLQYPEYDAKFALRRFKYAPQKKVLLLHSPPKGQLDLDKGKHKSDNTVNKLIRDVNPEIVFCGHAHKAQGTEQIGGTLVVNPGALKYGYFAVVDTETKKVDFRTV